MSEEVEINLGNCINAYVWAEAFLKSADECGFRSARPRCDSRYSKDWKDDEVISHARQWFARALCVAYTQGAKDSRPRPWYHKLMRRKK